MKAQFILLLLLAGLISTKGFSINKEPKTDERKPTKIKYEFNLFKFSTIDTNQGITDSLKTISTILYLKRKDI